MVVSQKSLEIQRETNLDESLCFLSDVAAYAVFASMGIQASGFSPLL